MLSLVLLITLTVTHSPTTPLERLDAANKAGQETLAIVAEEVRVDVKNDIERQRSLPKFSCVWIVGRKREQTEIAILRFGDVLYTGWLPDRVLRQGEEAMKLVGDQVAHDAHDAHDARARLAMAYLLVHSREGSQFLNALPTAAGLCDEVLRINPQCTEARVMLATLLGRLGSRDKAINEINKALSQEEHPWLYCIRAGLYARLGLYQKAVNDFTVALARAPKEWHHHQYVRSELEKARARLKAEND